MRKVLGILAVFSALASAFKPAWSFSQTPAGNTNAGNILVMISVDGLAAFYFDDPKAEMPTIRELAANGARAKAMKAVAPTVTWPNHTTLVTGVTPAKHGVVGNNYLDRATAKKVTLISDPVYDKEQIVKVPTIYDLAKTKGMKTASILWPATRNAKTLDWTYPDVVLKSLMAKYATPGLLDDLQKEGIRVVHDPDAKQSNKDKHEPNDEDNTRAFIHILRKHRPNLALLHLIQVDHTQHLNGPRSDEAYAVIKTADDQVRRVWEVLKRDFPDQAMLIIVSDHGFSPIKRTILPNVALRKAGLLTGSKKHPGGDIQIVVQGGAALVYVLDTNRRTELLEKLNRTLLDVPGVAKVLNVEQFKEYGVANPKDDPHAPDMVLFSDFGCSFGDTAAGELPFDEKPERKGSHGHDQNYPDLKATFVAWGAGIKSGVQLEEIPNTSVAPTIARLIKVTIPSAEGEPLLSILKD